jgi:hypothetical protein
MASVVPRSPTLGHVSDGLDINRTLTDAAYIAIGFGLLGFQRAQVRRRQLIRQLEEAARQAATLATRYGPGGAAGDSQ